MGLTSQVLFGKLLPEERKPMVECLEEVLRHGHGEVIIKIQNSKIVFVQAIKNFKS